MGDTTRDIFGADSVFGDDPFADRNPFKAQLARYGRGYSAREPARFPPLPPEEARPLTEALLDVPVSGLHYVGSTLDKLFGGRAIRGALGGRPRELLSLIPGSDTIGLTDPEEAVSGADLLEGMGYDTAKGNWFERNILPAAVEIGLDPGSYINPLGALGKAGKLASGLGHTQGWTRKMLTQGFTHTEPGLRALGKSADEIAHLANQGLEKARIAPQSLVDAAAAKGITLEAGTPLRGALGLGLPFREPLKVIGTGPTAEAFAGVLDDLGRGIKRLPGVPGLRALLDSRVMRAVDPGVQDAAEFAGRPAQEAADSWTRRTVAGLRQQLDDLLGTTRTIPGAENEALRLIRANVEEPTPLYTDPARWSADLARRYGTVLPNGQRLALGVQDRGAVERHILGNWAAYRDMAARIRAFDAEILAKAEALGLSADELDDLYAHYGPRRYIGAGAGLGGRAQSRQFPTVHGSNLRRKVALTGIPGASEQLDEWAMLPELSGATRPLARDQVAARVLADMQRHIDAMFPAGSPEHAAALRRAGGKSREVADWLATVPDVHAAETIPFFNPDIIGDIGMRGQRHARVAGSQAALLRGVVDLAEPYADLIARGERPIRLGDFLRTGGRAGLVSGVRDVPFDAAEEAAIAALGFTDRDHLLAVWTDPLKATPAERAALAAVPPSALLKFNQVDNYGAAARAYEMMARRGFGPLADVNARGEPAAKYLNEYGLTPYHADALSRFLQGWTAPTEAHPFLAAWRGMQNVFKNLVYPIWPASHVRNAVSAFYNNFLHGTDLGDYLDAARIMRQRGVGDPTRYGLAAGTDPLAAARELNRGAYADAKVYMPVNQYTEMVGGRGLDDERLLRGLRGDTRLSPLAPGAANPEGWLEMFRAKGALDPFGQAGLGGGPLDRRLRGPNAAMRHEDTFAPLRLGRRIGTDVEDFVRLANYLGNLRRGMASSRAGALTRAIHFDYQDLTKAEQALKNFIPFYTFMRKNLPYQVRMAFEEPNKVLPALHLMGATDPDGPWRPEYLASGAAVPIGDEEGGTQRFLTKFGLPIEEAAERFKFRNVETPWGTTASVPSPGGTMLAFLGSTSPYIKGPLEAATDRQFHTGRQLSDLHSKGVAGGFGVLPEEYAQPLTQLLANSPFARFQSLANAATDTREGAAGKALVNYLTGLRISDVDLAKQRAIAARKQLEAILKADPRVAEFLNFYAAPGATITPDLERRLRLFSRYKADAKAYHEEQERLRALHGGLRPGL